ncbi:unnamed protein product [Euphydryas editha]|uniref:DDE-1 domain-containing protein n=1 Tax=Euphydryas editha TaxID=104508 RepID=A0AAU9UCV5_EUPED|nr:unnamed protein product [Euphydryas editha]
MSAQIVSAERGELVTFGGIISASGNTIPLLFIFPRVYYNDHLEDAINYWRDNGIVCLSFPPHMTHRLQSLDVGVFGLLKSKLKTSFNDCDGDFPPRTPPNLSRDALPPLLSEHFASTVIDFDNPAPSTSKVLKKPEIIRAFPKVQRGTQTKKRIEELEKIKHIKRLEKEHKSKAREIKRALSLLNEDCDKSSKPKRNKTKEIKTNSSDSEDVSLRESSASPFDVFDKMEEEDDMKSLFNKYLSFYNVH